MASKYNSEEEFLKNYDPSVYDRIAVGVDILVVGISNEKVTNYRKTDKKKMSILLVKRDEYPFKDMWCLPCGFININEELEEAPKRILKREANIEDIYLEQLYTYGGVNRDPRMRVISSSYLSLVDKDRLEQHISKNASWFDIIYIDENNKHAEFTLSNGNETIKFDVKKRLREKTTDRYSFSINKNDSIAFDHPLMILSGIERLRNKLEYTDVVFNMMPKEFTLGELQKVYEVILGKKLLDAAFRRIIAGKVEKTDNIKKGEGHRPSVMFKYKAK